MEPMVTVDGKEVKASELPILQEQAKKEGKLIKEVSPGVFKTLEKLKD